MLIVLCALGTLSVFGGVLSGYLSLKNKMGSRLLAKTVGSVLFILVAIIASLYKKQYSDYSFLVVTALVFGMLGDIFLCLDKLSFDRYAIMFKGVGMLSFLVGHLFFIAIFLSTAPFKWYLLPLILIMPLAVFIAYKLKFVKAGKLLVPLVVYSVILGFMAVSAVCLFISDNSALGCLVLIAGLLFASSDTALCIRDFGRINLNSKKILVFVVLSTYYIAQVLFALTVYFF